MFINPLAASNGGASAGSLNLSLIPGLNGRRQQNGSKLRWGIPAAESVFDRRVTSLMKNEGRHRRLVAPISVTVG
jgi:hypothetical protein